MKITLFSILLLSLLLVSCKNNQNSDSENVVSTEETTVESVSEETSVANNDIAENDSDEDISENDSDEDNTEADDTNATSDAEDWDAILDSYEEYVNNYISLLKKAKNGDMKALSEYPAVMDDAQELSEKLQNAKGSMSSSQLSRYTRITTKMTQAAASIY